MLGLPGETEADLHGIAELSARVAAAGGRRVEVTASVSTFVPKPHTPFQWTAQIDLAETEARQSLLRRELQRQSSELKRLFETVAAGAGAALQGHPDPASRLSASWREVIGFESEQVSRLGRIFDLTVIARRGPRGSFRPSSSCGGRSPSRGPPASPSRAGPAGGASGAPDACARPGSTFRCARSGAAPASVRAIRR